jgi:hypothetical protein
MKSYIMLNPKPSTLLPRTLHWSVLVRSLVGMDSMFYIVTCGPFLGNE